MLWVLISSGLAPALANEILALSKLVVSASRCDGSQVLGLKTRGS